MAASAGNVPEANVPEALAAALLEGRLVVSVGSGFSRAASLPSWVDLLSTITRECNLAWEALPQASDSHDSMDQLQFEVVRQAGREEACRVMRQELHGKTSADMTRLLDALFALPIAAVITWNWDDVLDSRCLLLRSDMTSRSFEAVLRSRARALRAKQVARTPPLLKLQGHLDDLAKVVLDEADYARVKPVRDAFLRRLYVDSGMVVLHLGSQIDCGGVVGPIRSVLSGQERHYAIVPNASEALHETAKKQGVRLLSYDGTSGHVDPLCGWLGVLLDRCHKG